MAGPKPMKLKIQELISKTEQQTKTLSDLRDNIDIFTDEKELQKLECVLRFMRGFKDDLQNLLKK